MCHMQQPSPSALHHHCLQHTPIFISASTQTFPYQQQTQPCLPRLSLPGHHAVAVVCGDTVASAPTEEFLARANSACRPLSDPCNGGEAAADEVPSPVIPHLYDRVAQWQMEQFGVTREQLVGDGSAMLDDT